MDDSATSLVRLIPVENGDNPTEDAFVPVLIPWEVAYFGRPRVVKFPFPVVVDVPSQEARHG